MSANKPELERTLPFSSVKEVKEEDQSPIRSIFCLKSKSDADIKRIEETEDCFILEFDPYESIESKKFFVPAHDDGSGDLFFVGEKGKVACRDYAHSRHLCLNFPFESTPHENYCNLCYCYVCDSPAPCKFWTDPKSAHCDVSPHVKDWASLRIRRRLLTGGV